MTVFASKRYCSGCARLTLGHPGEAVTKGKLEICL